MIDKTHVIKDLLQRLASFTAENKIIEAGSVEEEVPVEVDGQTRGQGPVKEELQAPVYKKTPAFEAQGPLVEVNLGSADKPELTKVSGLLAEPDKVRLVELIKRYKDCFAWDYHEMPGLSRSLVEHRLPIK